MGDMGWLDLVAVLIALLAVILGGINAGSDLLDSDGLRIFSGVVSIITGLIISVPIIKRMIM